MANVTDLFCALIKRAGLPDNSELLTTITSNESMKAIEVQTSTYNTILSNLYNADQAKADPKIKQSIYDITKAEIYDKLDATINPLIDELGEEGVDLKKEVKTTAKITGLLEKRDALAAKKYGASAGDKKALQEKIDAINAQVVSERKAWEKKEADLVAAHENTLTDIIHASNLNTYKYGLKGVSSDIAALTAKTGFQIYLEQKGVKLKKDGNGLIPVTNDGSPYTENNEKVSYKTMLDTYMGSSGLLEVTPTNTTGNGNGTYTPPANTSGKYNTNPILQAIKDIQPV